MKPDPATWLFDAGGYFHVCTPDPSCRYCTTDTGSGFDWSFLDRIYCISLRSREDRAATAAAELHRVGLCRRTLFYRPLKHPTWPLVGIWESHRTVARHALDSGCRTALILEDDVIFTRRLRPRTVQKIAEGLRRLPSDWMLFFLGHMPWRAHFVRYNILRVCSTGAHAYIASRRLLAWLRDRPFGTPGIERLSFAGMGIDAAYAKLRGAYALFPMVVRQSTSASDNIKRPGKVMKITKPKHIFSRTRYREVMIGYCMLPSQFLIALLSPVFLILHWLDRAKKGA